MSSINSKANTEEVLNMTMQWGYKTSRASQQSEPASTENGTLSKVFQTMKPVFNFVSMITGAATALAILVAIAWLNGILQIPA